MDSSFIVLGSEQVLPWDSHSSLMVLHQLKLFGFPIPSGLIVIAGSPEAPFFAAETRQLILKKIQDSSFGNKIALTLFVSGETEWNQTIRCQSHQLASIMDQGIITFPPDQLSSVKQIALLISDSPEAQIHGTALTETGYQDDLVDFVFSGEDTSHSPQLVPVDKLTLGEQKVLGDFRGHIQDLLRSIRKALGEDNWKISWVDTGAEVLLTSIERVSAPSHRKESFSPISAFQILPTPLNNLAGSLAASCSSKLLQYFKNWYPELSPQRCYIKFNGYNLTFNISLLSDLMRTFGLSDRALQDVVNAQSFPIHAFNGIRFWKNLPRFIRFCHDAQLGTGIAKKIIPKLQNFDTSAEKTFAELFLEWQSIFISSSHGVYRLTQARFLLITLANSMGLGTIFEAESRGFLLRSLRAIFFPLVRYRIRNEHLQQHLTRISIRDLQKIQDCLHMKSLGLYSKGIFHSSDQIWMLSMEEVLLLDKGWRPDANFWRERFLQIKRNSDCSPTQTE